MIVDTEGMARCPICDTEQPRIFIGVFDCARCGTELKIAGSTLRAMILIPVLILLPACVLLQPAIGRGGVIALGLVCGHLLPWVIFVLFYRVEPSGHFDLSEARGVERPKSWARRVNP